MEWSGSQQVWLLLQSTGLGFGLGFVYDVLQLPCYCGGGRIRRFVMDVLFGAVAALVTFYVALALMDGRLHPLLFFGSGVGFLAQHSCIGHWLCRGLRRLAAGWRRMKLARKQAFASAAAKLTAWLSAGRKRLFCCRKPATAEKVAEKRKKNRKKGDFFTKTP